ncbi:armadillo-type protein [Pholiota molesta]|nr:armadillo-type protein [Pholiota molesta]
MIKQLGHQRWSVREKTIQLLVKLFDLDLFHETMNTDGIIPEIVAKLEDDDSDVRAAAVEALRVISTSDYDLYYSDIKSSTPSIMKQLGNDGWSTRREVIRLLAMLAENVVFQETIKTNGVVTKFIVKLEDDDDDVRTAAIEALVALAKKGSSSNQRNSTF